VKWAALRVIGYADGRPASGYVARYDPDAHDGFGDVELSDDPARALRFVDFTAAHAAWVRQSRVRPLRSDGRPNRPLTAYTVAIELLP
jgi:hypothetical protein